MVLSRLFDTFPASRPDCTYCCGTGAEAGGTPVVLDEISAFGRTSRMW